MSRNQNLNKAKNVKNDEFYTRYCDIEAEVCHYKKHLENKVVFCNCDDPRKSNFFRYFFDNFHKLKLKKVYCSCYKNELSGKALFAEYSGEDIRFIDIPLIELKGDGDFRSHEVIRILRKSDVVITNPPFSLFREFFQQLIKYDKQFLILEDINGLSFKIVNRRLFKTIFLGINRKSMRFINKDKFAFFGKIRWLTNIDHKFNPPPIILKQSIKTKKYQKYDDFDAIEIAKTEDIPYDYFDVMGVPISFVDKYDSNQFEIIGVKSPTLNGKKMFTRVFIKRKIS